MDCIIILVRRWLNCIKSIVKDNFAGKEKESLPTAGSGKEAKLPLKDF